MLMVATPHTRAFEGAYVESLLQMEKPEGMCYIRLEGQPVDAARNRLAASFLESDSRFLLFVDSDATWPPEAARRLMRLNLPVVTACIYRRGLPPVPTFGTYAGINGEGNHAYNFGWSIRRILELVEKLGIDPDEAPNAVCFNGDRVEEIEGCGMHFCMIRRDVLEKVGPRPFAAEDGAGEDFYFCRRVQRAGFGIFVNLAIHTGHLAGPGFEVGLREMLAFYRHTQILRETEEVWDVGNPAGVAG